MRLLWRTSILVAMPPERAWARGLTLLPLGRAPDRSEGGEVVSYRTKADAAGLRLTITSVQAPVSGGAAFLCLRQRVPTYLEHFREERPCALLSGVREDFPRVSGFDDDSSVHEDQ